MTAGQDALREAARLEAARVYGQLCEGATDDHVEVARFEAQVLHWRLQGCSVAAVALRLAAPKSTVEDTLRKLGAA